jgi:hypothetical protein
LGQFRYNRWLLNDKSLIFKIGRIAKIKKDMGVLPQGILTPSFIEIALAVTKRHALLTDDDDDGRHVIAISHQKGELKMMKILELYQYPSTLALVVKLLAF